MDIGRRFSKYYQRSLDARMDILKDFVDPDLGDLPDLEADLANGLIENYLGNYHIPLGLAVNVQINGQDYVIPMATEESSVVAAVSNAGKVCGNVQTSYTHRDLVGQVIMWGLETPSQAKAKIQSHRETVLGWAKEASPSMVERGGGPRDFWLEEIYIGQDAHLCFYLSFDPCDAMGANAINTVLEDLAGKLEDLVGGRVLMAILSNYSESSLAKAQVDIPWSRLDKPELPGRLLSERIAAADAYAHQDVYRATTHNKGILNGMEAVVAATANDTRAFSASVHAYASRQGRYQALTQWSHHTETESLRGTLEVPSPIGVLGGAISLHPQAQWVLKVLRKPSAACLSQIIVAVGLLQNFAALRALVSEGIQKGHMHLHASNMARKAGAHPEELAVLIQRLQAEPKISQSVAEKILKQMRENR